MPVIMVVRMTMVVVMPVVVVMVVMAVIVHGFQRARLGMAVHRSERQTVLAAELLVAAGGIAVTAARAIFQSPAYPLDVVVMAFLGKR